MANSSESFSNCCASVGLCALGALRMGNSGDSPNAWIDMALCTSYNRITSSFHSTHAAPASLVLLEPRWGRGKKEFLAKMWKSSSEPLYYSFEVTGLFYFHHKAAFLLINQILTYSDRNFLMPEAWCSSFCEAQSYRLSWLALIVRLTQPELPKEHHLRNCPDQGSLWECLWEVVLIVNW